MTSPKPGKVFNLGIRQEVAITISQLNGMFNHYLQELQTVSVKPENPPPKKR